MNVNIRACQDLFPARSDIKAVSGSFDIDISSDIDAIQSDWESLEKEDILTPFQRRAWLLPLYAILAPRFNATPVFVLVRDKVSRRPLMLLPLCARRRYGITIIEFADFGVSDYNAPVISKAFNPSPMQWQELWRHITKALKKSSILWLKKMPHLIGDLPNPLIQYGKQPRLMSFASWGVALPETLAEYKRGLSPSFAKELARKFRRVAKRGNIEYSIARTQKEKRMAFGALVQQRQARFDEMRRSNNILAKPVHRQFYEAVAVESQEELLSLGMLKVGSEIVATILALSHRNAVHVIMSTFQGGEWKSCSLGNVVIQSAIEHAIGNGVGFFDLTIGNENYKQDFGAMPNGLYFTLQALTPISSPIALIMTYGAYIKNTARQSVLNVGRNIGKNLRAKQHALQKRTLSIG